MAIKNFQDHILNSKHVHGYMDLRRLLRNLKLKSGSRPVNVKTLSEYIAKIAKVELK